MKQSQPVLDQHQQKIPLLWMLLLVLATFALGAVLGLVFQFWLGKFNPGSDQITITYTTEQGAGASSGRLDSPLTVAVRIPWQTGSQDSVLSGVDLEIVDESGNPAPFGVSEPHPLPMKPTLDITVWDYSGSVPSKPGRYHARLQIKRLYGNQPPELIELPDPAIRALESGDEPIKSGYLFNNEANLWLLSADAVRGRRLTFLDSREELASEPAWSHDGSKIAYAFSSKTAQNEIPRTEIWTITADGANPQPLVPHTGNESLSYPYWTSDGKYLYFTVETAVMDSSGIETGQMRRVDRLELATGVRSQIAPFASTPSTGQNSEDLLYVQDVQSPNPTSASTTQKLVRGSSDGSLIRTLVDDPQFLGLYGPRMSPDGRWVVFSGATAGEGGSRRREFDLLRWLLLEPEVASAHEIPWEVYLVPSTGGPIIRLTKLAEDQPHPVWMDNTTIAFIGLKGLYRVSIDGQGAPVGEPARLRDGARHGALSWYAP